MNQQPPEKIVTDTTIDLHSVFYTIQGEGPFCGTPAVFVRLAGCNLQCPSCDTEYTKGRKTYSIAAVREMVKRLHPTTALVVITGGEPFRQAATGDLALELMEDGFYVQIETNGTLPVPNNLMQSAPFFEISQRHGAYIVVSPKTGSVTPSVMRMACAFKYVLHHEKVNPVDGLPISALNHSAKPQLARVPNGKSTPIYLQPEDSYDPEVNAKNIKACVQSCLTHGYTLQLQVHKLAGVE